MKYYPIIIFCILSISIFGQSNQAKDSIYAYNLLVDVALPAISNNYELSKSTMLEAYDIYQKQNNIQFQSDIMVLQIRLYSYWHKLELLEKTLKSKDSILYLLDYPSTMDSLEYRYDYLLRVGTTHVQIGKYEEARQNFEKVRTGIEKLDSLNRELEELQRISCLSIATIENTKGNYKAAEDIYKFAIERNEHRSKIRNVRPIDSNYGRLARAQQLQGKHVEAATNYKKCLMYYDSLVIHRPHDISSFNEYISMFALHAVQNALDIGDIHTADSLMSILNRMNTDYNYNKIELGITNAIRHQKEGNLEEAYTSLNLPNLDLDHYSATQLFKAYYLLVDLQLHLQDPVKAKYWLDKRKEIGEKNTISTQINFENSLLEARLTNDYQECSRLLDQRLTDPTVLIEDKISTLELYRPVYLDELEFLLDKSHIDTFQIYTQFKKGQDQLLLKEQIQNQYLKSNTTVYDSISALSHIIQKIENKIQLISDDTKSYYLKEDLISHIEKRKKLLSKISIPINTNELNISEDFNKVLSDDLMNLFYVVNNSKIHILVLGQGTFKPIQIEGGNRIKETIAILNELLRSPISDITLIKEKGQDIYEQLFYPVESYITDANLRILADDFIYSIPFEALFDGKGYLGQQYNFSYGQDYNKEPSKFSQSILAIAPDFSDYPAVFSNDIASRSAITQLKYNVPESKNITDVINGKLVTGESINQTQLLQSVNKYSILHFATHAKWVSSQPDYSYISLGKNENNVEQKLYKKDIGLYNFNQDMVCLSACETGIGRYVSSEGVQSLGRAFQASGVKSVIPTMWSVNDKSTSIIMTNFYKELRKGKRKDEALRQAKLTYLENADPEYQHPYYWAGFIAMGDMSPLFYPNRKYYYGGIALLSLAFLFLVYKKKFSPSRQAA